MKRHAGVRDLATADRRGVGRLVAVGLAIGAVILVLSGLVGALDLLAVGAVLGVWALLVAARVILGRYGEDWALPAETHVPDGWQRVLTRPGRATADRPAGAGTRPWDRARQYLTARRGQRAGDGKGLRSPASPSGAMGPGAVRADVTRPGAARPRPGGGREARAGRAEATVGPAPAGAGRTGQDPARSRRP